jgi:HSP20 family protein
MPKALTRRWGEDISPWREFDLLSDRMRGLMDPMSTEPLISTPIWDTAGWVPAVELTEADNEYLLTAELPGVTKGDVEVSIDDGVLTLKGEKKTEKEEKRGKTHYRERRYGAFERAFTLPRNVEADKIKAEFKDGLIEVHLPKGEEAKGRKIELK